MSRSLLVAYVGPLSSFGGAATCGECGRILTLTREEAAILTPDLGSFYCTSCGEYLAARSVAEAAGEYPVPDEEVPF
jgi:predicted RNA-binding Zn-ribbon protein involved in translation (DUF1610 family)